MPHNATEKPEPLALGDVLMLGDSPTRYVVVEVRDDATGIGMTRFVPEDTDEARRVLATVRQRAAQRNRKG